MDGPWQTGHKTADEYGRLAAETARAMRRSTPASSSWPAAAPAARCPPSPQWESTVLEHAYDPSTTSACTPTTRSARATWRASSPSVDMDRFIRPVVATADRVGARDTARSGSTSPSTSGTSGT